jgi:multicomponent Na+:H+ antiporter subunit D
MASDAWIASLPPGLFLILAGAILTVTRGGVRSAILLSAPLFLLVWVWLLPSGEGRSFLWLGLELTPVRVDALSRLFATVFAAIGFGGALFALKQERTSELASALIYAGAAIGVVFAGDLVTVFVFWEVMAVASTLVVLAGGAGARAAAQRYIVIHLFGGVLLMAGIAGYVGETGSTAFDLIAGESHARWLILAGFLLNAGAWPLSAWLPDAYPRASWSGTVFLSAFTTKTAVYVLIRGFAGEDVLVWLGLIMAFYGIIYAILENDMRRILAYSIVNQVGFMVVGIGIGTEMAVNGAAAHAFAHIIYKALLLMSAGAVLYQTGKSKCTELGGLFRTMPLTTVCGIVGAMSISAFPLTSGFVAKSMISEGAAGEHMEIVWFLLAAASAGVFLHAGIKFPWFVFFQKDSGLRPPDPPISMRAAMVLLSALCLIIGVIPSLLYSLLPYEVGFVPYTVPHVVSQLQLLLFSGLAFFLLLRLLRRTETLTLDVDWLWRTLIPAIGRWLVSSGDWRFWTALRAGIDRFASGLARLTSPGELLVRSWPTGIMAFWATVLLAAYLVLYYL